MTTICPFVLLKICLIHRLLSCIVMIIDYTYYLLSNTYTLQWNLNHFGRLKNVLVEFICYKADPYIDYLKISGVYMLPTLPVFTTALL